MSVEISRLGKAIRWLDDEAGRRGFLFKVGMFPLLDYALPFLPNQMLLIALALLQRSRWLALALTFAIASAIGALTAALIVQFAGGGIANWLTSSVDGAEQALALVENYGLTGLAMLALLPWPPRTGVIVCAIAGLPPIQIMLAVGAGRLVPAAAIAFLAARSPLLLRRIPGIDRQLVKLELDRGQGAGGR